MSFRPLTLAVALALCAASALGAQRPEPRSRLPEDPERRLLREQRIERLEREAERRAELRAELRAERRAEPGLERRLGQPGPRTRIRVRALAPRERALLAERELRLDALRARMAERRAVVGAGPRSRLRVDDRVRLRVAPRAGLRAGGRAVSPPRSRILPGEGAPVLRRELAPRPRVRIRRDLSADTLRLLEERRAEVRERALELRRERPQRRIY